MNLKTCILIPAFEPDHHLLELIQEIRQHSADIAMIVVNDGSSASSQPIFDALPALDVQVLQHPHNKGKGAALKTGFAYWLQQEPSSCGVVTADADGQHRAEDIFKLVYALEREPQALHLGCRKLNKEQTPLRSWLGNRVTARLLSFFTRQSLQDTQTGLRAIPSSFIPALLDIESDGYALETEMLLLAKKADLTLRQHAIQTIYLDHNKSSHFNPLLDSIKIYWVFIRYTLISICSALIDLTTFVIMHLLTGHIFLSLVIARAISGVFNYAGNRNTVFKSQASPFKSACLYLLLVIINIYCAFLFIHAFLWVDTPIYLAKILSESTLFILNFCIQRFMIFKQALPLEKDSRQHKA
jgi:glycosyltransferase involved in cell wall biosynthesis